MTKTEWGALFEESVNFNVTKAGGLAFAFDPHNCDQDGMRYVIAYGIRQSVNDACAQPDLADEEYVELATGKFGKILNGTMSIREGARLPGGLKIGLDLIRARAKDKAKLKGVRNWDMLEELAIFPTEESFASFREACEKEHARRNAVVFEVVDLDV